MSDFVIENGVLKKYTGKDADVVIPDSVTEIGGWAFSGCSSLTSLTIPDSVKKIGDWAFRGCSGLTSVTIPDSVMEISEWAFDECNSLANITVDENNKNYSSQDGVLFNKDKTTLIKYPAGNERTEYTIPDSVTEIGKRAFYGCSSLTSVTIGNGVTSIGEDAFSGCIGLTSITIPDSITSINHGAFYYCQNLASITIGNSVTNIGKNAFYSCRNLTSIKIPDSVTSIGGYAFWDCSGLTSVTIPDSVMEIGSCAFWGCSGLTSVTIPDSVTSIGSSAFYGCSGLTSVTIPDILQKIGNDWFNGCTKLHNVTLPDILPTFESGAFKGCDKINFDLAGTITETNEALSGELARGSIKTTDAGLAHLILFQRTPLWKTWKNTVNINDPETIFEHMLTIARAMDKPDTKLGGPIADYIFKYKNKLPKEKVQSMLSLFKGLKCKEINALLDDPYFNDSLSDSKVPVNPVEADAASLLEHIDADPNVVKAVSKGIHYRDSKAICSREVLIAIISYYAKEWKRCAESVESEMIMGSYVEILENASLIAIDPTIDRIAASLNEKELSAFLEKKISGPSYRTFLLSWARFADEESVKNQTAAYKSLLHGTAKEKYLAQNLAEALMISPTRSALLFFDQNNLLDRFASYKKTTAAELRDTLMLPDFGFDPSGAKLFDIGGDIIEARLTDRFDFELYDRENAKSIKSFPKKSSNPDKAQAAAEEYKTFKKQIMDFIKLRTEQLKKLHQTGFGIKPDLWQKVYLEHPVIKRLAKRVIWMDREGKTFIIVNGDTVDAALNKVQPTGSICVAHVLNLNADQISAWQQTLTKIGCVQLFEQIWEPVISWKREELFNRYKGLKISSKARNELKAYLKQRGIDVHAGEMYREYNPRTNSYDFSSENTLYLGNSLSLDYTVDDTTGLLTLGDMSVKMGSKNRELNAILFELDKVTASERIKKDDISVMQIIDQFTVAQISQFITVAQDAEAVNVLAALMEYKNKTYPDLDPMAEFTLDW